MVQFQNKKNTDFSLPKWNLAGFYVVWIIFFEWFAIVVNGPPTNVNNYMYALICCYGYGGEMPISKKMAINGNTI